MTYEPDPDDVRALRAMTLQERLERGLEFTHKVRQFKIDSIRAHHPGWNEERVMNELRQWTVRGMNPGELYPWWP
jgi:hypothetical protein